MQVLKAENLDLKNLLSARKVSLIASAAVLLVGVTTAAVSNSMASGSNNIPGVKFEGRPIEGMDAAATRDFIQKAAAEKIHAMTFRNGDQEFEITPDDVKLTPLVENAVSEAQSYGRGKGFANNLKEQLDCFFNGRNIELAAVYSEDLLNQKIDAIAQEVAVQPVNAGVQLNADDTITHIPGTIGKELDKEKLAESLKEPLTNLELPIEKIDLALNDIQPFISDEDVANIDSIIGEYSTYYYPGDRGDNIALAAYALTDKIVKPGWTFSFNDTVGRRTYAAGYKNAGVIINGESAIDVGGGVCQVSSTLYNAVLLAGLTPTERTPHFFKSSYIGAGRDATVADGQIDFKFRNDLPHSVYLKSYPSGSTLTICVLGTKADLGGASISIEREGYDMSPSIYRVYYKDGQVVKNEFLHTDSYHTHD